MCVCVRVRVRVRVRGRVRERVWVWVCVCVCVKCVCHIFIMHRAYESQTLVPLEVCPWYPQSIVSYHILACMHSMGHRRMWSCVTTRGRTPGRAGGGGAQVM